MLIPDHFKDAWDIARKNFGHDIHFYAPSIKSFETSEFSNKGNCQFIPVSITGSYCELNCGHCSAGILKSMEPAATPDGLIKIAEEHKIRGIAGLLISGGSDKNGIVPLMDFLPAIKEIKERLEIKVFVHTGLVDDKLAEGLKDAEADSVLIDIIGSEETIREVYHLKGITTEDYEESLKSLQKYCLSISPHIVIGLHYGKIKGEFNALRIIAKYKPSSLIIVVITPLHNTPMENISLPSIEEVSNIFQQARRLLPDTPIILGCERGFGRYKAELDITALKSGFNGIAYPSEGVVEMARELGLRSQFSFSCCAMGLK
ncbi:MAG: radical SAM protein [Nitrospirota bacterium]